MSGANFEHYCTVHKHGWNTDEEGMNSGCVWCNIEDEEARKIDEAYEAAKEREMEGQS